MRTLPHVAVLLVASWMMLGLAGCQQEGSPQNGAPPPHQDPPTGDPDPQGPSYPLEGNWSLQSATCDGEPQLIFPGMLTFHFTGDDLVAQTHLPASCNYRADATAAFPDATSISVTDLALSCNPVNCDSNCGKTYPGPQTITYARSGNTITLESAEQILPNMCTPGEITVLTFKRI